MRSLVLVILTLLVLASAERVRKPALPIDFSRRSCLQQKDAGPCEAAITKWFYNRKTKQCETFTYGGCKGNSNRFDSQAECEKQCQRSKPNVDTCALNSDSGPCKAIQSRWFFNSKTQECEVFTYGGCKGNANNFATKDACEKRCSPNPKPKPPTNICELPAVPGPCKAAFSRWFYNSNTQMCEEFTWGGCGGNGNNFKTKTACEKQCRPADVDKCALKADPGPCRAAISRWFFNTKTGMCEKFTYGGCKGNANNFKTILECEEACSKGPVLQLCGEKGDSCIDTKSSSKKDTPFDSFSGCCKGLRCCVCGPPVSKQDVVPQKTGVCLERCICPRG